MPSATRATLCNRRRSRPRAARSKRTNRLGDKTMAHVAANHHEEHPAGILRWLTTTNHKDIGTLYLLFALVMWFIGGAMALIIRAELWIPGLQIADPHFYNQMVTMHALIMVFGVVMPAFVGFANWQIPMMI